MNSNNTITAFSIANTTTGSPIIYYSGITLSNKVPSKTASATKFYTKTDVNGINAAQTQEQIAILQRTAKAGAAVRENYINRFSEYFGVF